MLQTFAVIDWIVTLAVLWGMLQGARKGFGEMAGKVLEVLLVGILVLTFYPALASKLSSMVPALPQKVAVPMAFILLGVFIWLSVSWCFKILGKFMKFDISGSLKSLGGLLGGGLYFFLLLSFLSQFLLLFPIDAIQRAYQVRGSYIGTTLARTMPDIQKATIGFLPKKVKKLAPQAGQ